MKSEKEIRTMLETIERNNKTFIGKSFYDMHDYKIFIETQILIIYLKWILGELK